MLSPLLRRQLSSSSQLRIPLIDACLGCVSTCIPVLCCKTEPTSTCSQLRVYVQYRASGFFNYPNLLATVIATRACAYSTRPYQPLPALLTTHIIMYAPSSFSPFPPFVFCPVFLLISVRSLYTGYFECQNYTPRDLTTKFRHRDHIFSVVSLSNMNTTSCVSGAAECKSLPLANIRTVCKSSPLFLHHDLYTTQQTNDPRSNV